MRLSKLKIENFRGIRLAEIEFDRDITVLIGENNAGKTTIIDALRLCLDTIKSDKTCNFTEYDFYRDDTYQGISFCQPIRLTLIFLETEKHLWPEHITQALNEIIVGSDYSAIKLRVTAQYDAIGADMVQNLEFLDDNENEMPGRSRVITDLHRLRPFFFQSALRAAKDQFHSQSTYWASFLGSKDIDENTRKALEEELLKVNQKIIDSHASFKDVTAEMQRISELVAVGKAQPVSVDPAPADVYKSLRYTDVNLLTTSNAKIPLRSHGEGTQSLSVLLLFSAYLKTRLQADVGKKAEPIVAIEEPEAHLHPNAIRSVWRLLQDLPGQKIVATHSGDILSEVPITKLRRLRPCGSATECKAIQETLLNAEELRKFNHHVRRSRGELLFAKCWLLVEGETDLSVFVESAELLGIDLNQNGVRIVEYVQAGGPGIFVKVADSLAINWHLVGDNDQSGQNYVRCARKLLYGRDEAKHISVFEQPNIDIFLCCNDYGKPYRDGVGPLKAKDLTAKVGTAEYWQQVYTIVNNARGFSKPAAAMESIMLMKEKGKSGVPNELKHILAKAVELVESDE